MAGYRKAYTIEEEKTILQYIFDNKYFHRLRGLQVFKEISRNKIPDRTYQSLHERFRKHIIKNLSNPEYGLSKQDQRKLKTIYDGTAHGQKVFYSDADSTNLDTNFQDLTNSDSGNENAGVTSSIQVSSISCNDELPEAGPSSRDDNDANTITSNDNSIPSTSRNSYKKPYTIKEEKEILNYIFGNKCFYNLRGHEVWKNISRDRIPERTYQSLHQRFRKHIIKNLQNPEYGLSMEDQMKLKRIYDGTAHGKRGRAEQSEGTSSVVLARDFHDLSDSDLDIENPDDVQANRNTSGDSNGEVITIIFEEDDDTASEASEIFHLQ